MKETIKIRINYDYAHLLFEENEGKNLGTSVRLIEISTDDERYMQIPIIAKQVEERYNRGFYFGWEFKRKYTKKELEEAKLFRFKIKSAFEPTGEECGTQYDETVACEICGANRKQVGALKLKKGSIPKKDIARTIAGEVVVSERFVSAVNHRCLKGLVISPVLFGNGNGNSNYYQLTASSELELTTNTIMGDTPFTKTAGNEGGTFNISGHLIKFEKEVYICPKGDLIGLNLLSEPYVFNSPVIMNYDFFASKQKLGAKQGLLRPEPLYFCSPTFRKMIEEEKLSGFEFEVAHIEQNQSQH